MGVEIEVKVEEVRLGIDVRLCQPEFFPFVTEKVSKGARGFMLSEKTGQLKNYNPCFSIINVLGLVFGCAHKANA